MGLLSFIFGPSTPTLPPSSFAAKEGIPANDLVLKVGPVIAQGYLSACVGACLRGMLDCMFLQKGRVVPAEPTYEEIYRAAKGEGFNVGATVSQAFLHLKRLGLVAMWRFVNTKPHRHSKAVNALFTLYGAEIPVGLVVVWKSGLEFPWKKKNIKLEDIAKFGKHILLGEWKGDATRKGDPRFDDNHCLFIYGRQWHSQWGWLILLRNSRGADIHSNGSFFMQETEFLRMFAQDPDSRAFYFTLNQQS